MQTAFPLPLPASPAASSPTSPLLVGGKGPTGIIGGGGEVSSAGKALGGLKDSETADGQPASDAASQAGAFQLALALVIVPPVPPVARQPSPAASATPSNAAEPAAAVPETGSRPLAAPQNGKSSVSPAVAQAELFNPMTGLPGNPVPQPKSTPAPAAVPLAEAPKPQAPEAVARAVTTSPAARGEASADSQVPGLGQSLNTQATPIASSQPKFDNSRLGQANPDQSPEPLFTNALGHAAADTQTRVIGQRLPAEATPLQPGPLASAPAPLAESQANQAPRVDVPSTSPSPLDTETASSAKVAVTSADRGPQVVGTRSDAAAVPMAPIPAPSHADESAKAAPPLPGPEAKGAVLAQAAAQALAVSTAQDSLGALQPRDKDMAPAPTGPSPATVALGNGGQIGLQTSGQNQTQGQPQGQQSGSGSSDQDATGRRATAQSGPATVTADEQSADTAAFTPQGISETRASLITAAPSPEARATSQTAQALASDISRKVSGGSTRFDIALTPDGMGKVDVQITINARGEISASMNFESTQAASELRGRAGELQKALEQAGFNLSGDGLRFTDSQSQSFSAPQQQAGQQAWQEAQRRPSRDRAFQDSNELADATALKAAEATSAYTRRAAAGIDVRI